MATISRPTLQRNHLQKYGTNGGRGHEVTSIKSTTVEALANSDHCYIQVNRTGRKHYTEEPQVKRRNWSKIDWGFSRIYHTRNVNEVTERVIAAIQAVLDLQAPVKMQPNRKNYCPYFDDEIQKLTVEKKKLYKQYQKNKSNGEYFDISPKK